MRSTAQVFRRTLAILLSIMLVVGNLPLAALAEEPAKEETASVEEPQDPTAPEAEAAPATATEAATATEVAPATADDDGNAVRPEATTAGLALGDLRRAVAFEVEGYEFDRWEDGDGTVLGYGGDLEVKVQGDLVLVARYAPAGQTTTPVPVITIGATMPVSAGDVHKVAATASRDVPAGYELVEQGVLYARNVEGLTEPALLPAAA